MIYIVCLYVCVSTWLTFYAAGKLGFGFKGSTGERIAIAVGWLFVFLVAPIVFIGAALWRYVGRPLWENL